MKKLILVILLASFSYSHSFSKEKNKITVEIQNFSLEKDSNFLALEFSFPTSFLKLKRNEELVLTPYLKLGADSLELKSISIVGRKRYFSFLRNSLKEDATKKDKITYKKSFLPLKVEYKEKVPYSSKMSSANLLLKETLYGCCEERLRDTTLLLKSLFEPELLYIKPKVEKKERSLFGNAYVNFPIDKVEIIREFSSNKEELLKITNLIDSIKNDKDIRIKNISLKGYASPESPYSHNEELSKGRVNSLKNYIKDFYNLNDSLITIEYEAEDWEGVREFIKTSSIENKKEILKLIDSNKDPDKREELLKTTFKKEYEFLLENCYPTLRRTEYRINYLIKEYSDIDEILKVYKESPQKLSLNELYRLSIEYSPGSKEINSIFLKAAELYPLDEVANLNAANVAIKNRDFEAAKKYLLNLSPSPQAEYTRGVLDFYLMDYKASKEHLQKALNQGLDLAKDVIEKIKK